MLACEIDKALLERISAERREAIMAAMPWAEKIERVGGKNPYWVFTFDEGTYNGKTVVRMRQSQVSPLGIVNMLIGLNWPGSFSLKNRVNDAIMAILRNRS